MSTLEKARFSFIDDADNRLYLHFAQYDNELAELEAKIEELMGYGQLVCETPVIGNRVLGKEFLQFSRDIHRNKKF